MVFDDQEATAESGLVSAINQLKTAQVTDLVIDIRYNGGGYLDIASELAYMVAGPGPTAGQTFYNQQFSAKYPSTNPVTGNPLTPTAFHTQNAGAVPNGGSGVAYLEPAARFRPDGPIDLLGE